MGLKEALGQERQRRQGRRPWRPGLFARISAIVSHYRLNEAFLARLAQMQHREPEAAAGWPVAEKPPLPPVIFGLTGEEQFGLGQRIMELVDPAYLEFATTPEDILLAGPLYRRNPHLTPEQLAATPFQLLWRAETG